MYQKKIFYSIVLLRIEETFCRLPSKCRNVKGIARTYRNKMSFTGQDTFNRIKHVNGNRDFYIREGERLSQLN